MLFAAAYQPATYAIDEVLLEANQEALQNYRELYKQQIEKRFSDIHSGFNHEYQILPDENSFYTRLTGADVDFYAHLAAAIYANNAADKTDASVMNSLNAALEDLGKSNYKNLGLLHRNDGQHSAALLYDQSQNHAILVFAGTKSGTDLLVDAKYLRYTGADPYQVLKGPKGEWLSAHRGFAKVYLEGIQGFTADFANHIQNYQSQIKGHSKKLTVTTTGHSLGGAMSLIAAKDMFRILSQAGLVSGSTDFVIENITFGAPRVFGNESARIVENMLGKHNIIQFRDLRDPIPMVPPQWTYSLHIGTPIYIGKTNVLTQFVPLIDYHYMTNYLPQVRQAFEQIKSDAEYRLHVEESIRHYKEETGDSTPDSFMLYERMNALKIRLIEAYKARAFFEQQLKDAKAAGDKEKIKATKEILKHLRKHKKMLKNEMKEEKEQIEKQLPKGDYWFSPLSLF